MPKSAHKTIHAATHTTPTFEESHFHPPQNMKLAPPRGMRDFYPEDYRPLQAIFDVWRNAAALHGFELYDAPVVETQELLIRKAGEEITGQIYTFEDKSGRGLALRPEMTPSLARMIVARQGALKFPLKWSSIPQCFRYERMTRGRKREHYQWNLDVIGEESILAEAEVLATAVDAMRALGLTEKDFQIRVGSRALLGELFETIGVGDEHFAAACLALDKRGKINDQETSKLLADEGLGEADIKKVFELIGVKTFEEAQKQLGDETPGVRSLIDLFALAEDLGFADYLTFDLAVVRGLGYYAGILFEAFDTCGKRRAIFGGGRYDNLLDSLGGKPCACVGLGFGDVVLSELLKELGKLPATDRTVGVAIGYLDDTCRRTAARVAAQMRNENDSTAPANSITSADSVDLALRPEAAKKFFKRAETMGAAKSIYIGPDEVASGKIKVKDMATREEAEIRFSLD